MSVPEPTPAPQATEPAGNGADERGPAGAGAHGNGEPDVALSARTAEQVGDHLRELVDAERGDDDDGGGDESASEQGRGRRRKAPTEAEKREAMLFGLGLVPVDAESLGETDLGVCPFCRGYGACVADDVIAVLPAIVEQLAPFPQSSTFERCAECDGWGRVLTGARLGEPGIQPCPECSGNGYVDRRERERAAAIARGEEPPAPAPRAPEGPDPLRTPPPDGRPPAIGMIWNQDAYTWEYPKPA